MIAVPLAVTLSSLDDNADAMDRTSQGRMATATATTMFRNDNERVGSRGSRRVTKNHSKLRCLSLPTTCLWLAMLALAVSMVTRNNDEKRVLLPSLFVLGYVLPTSIGRGQPFGSKTQLRSGLGWSTVDGVAVGRETLDGRRRRRRTTMLAQQQLRREGRGTRSLALDMSARAASPVNESKGFARFVSRLISGRDPDQLDRPKWLDPNSKLAAMLPTWLFHLRPSVQLAATLVLYLFHTVVLTQNSLPLPVQLIPNDRGNFQSIGLDSLAGMGTLAFYQFLRRKPSNFFNLEVTKSQEETNIETEIKTPDDKNSNSNDNNNSTSAEATDNAVDPVGDTSFNYTTNSTTADAAAPATTITTTTTKIKTIRTTAIKASYLPDLWSAPHPRNMPWKSIWKSRYSKTSSLLALTVLSRAYFLTGQVSLFWEDFLYGMARHCEWMTIGMHRSLSVLLGHLSWVAMGAVILRVIPRPQPYFQEPVSQWFTSFYKASPKSSSSSSSINSGAVVGGKSASTTLTPGQLLSADTTQAPHPQWIWWAIGGYFVSSWLFNVVDLVNSYVFPLSVLEQAEESSVVAKLVNPEGQDVLASLVGFIAPCLTAPWWEEILYRGFLLPTLVLSVPNRNYWWATFLSGILFSVHHQSELAFLPLCVLGWIWAIVYTKSKNLWTTILIHSMWNSRIFLGSWFGL